MSLTVLVSGVEAITRARKNRERLFVPFFVGGAASSYAIESDQRGIKGAQQFRLPIYKQEISGDTVTFTCTIPDYVLTTTFGELAVVTPDGTTIGLEVGPPQTHTVGVTTTLNLTMNYPGLGAQMRMETSHVSLSTVRPDYDDVRLQLQAALVDKETFKGIVTNETGTTLVELLAGIAEFTQYSIESAYQEAFPDTLAKLDSSVYAGVIMHGVRITRKVPASVQVNLIRATTTSTLVIPAYSTFKVGNVTCFNRAALSFAIGEDLLQTTLYEGTTRTITTPGTGTDYQFFVSAESDFSVSDVDVLVRKNGVSIPVVQDPLWNYPVTEAVQEQTTREGQLWLRFGNANTGTKPLLVDTLTITYAVTNGASGNKTNVIGNEVSYLGNSDVSGAATSEFSGGGDQPSADVYRNVGGPLYAAKLGAVTPAQYDATARSYPGVLDAKILAQRHLAPLSKDWFMTAKVILLTSSPWDDTAIEQFRSWFESRTIYGMRYVILTGRGSEEPRPRVLDVRAVIYCKADADLVDIQAKGESAIAKLLAKQNGTLSRTIYLHDFHRALRVSSLVDYVDLILPTQHAVADLAALVSPSITPVATGTLSPAAYNYACTSYDADGESAPLLLSYYLASSGGILIGWSEVPGALGYKIYGRSGSSYGLLGTVSAIANQADYAWTDDGSITPGVSPPPISTSGVHYISPGNVVIQAKFTGRL